MIKPKQIIRAMDEKGIDIDKLTKALNAHVGCSYNYDKTRELVIDGADGKIAEIIAYELGLNNKYIPFFKTHVEQKKKKQNYCEDLPTSVYPRANGIYEVVIRHKNKSIYVGTFKSVKEAKKARDKKAKEIGKVFNKRDTGRKYVGVYWRESRSHFYSRIIINGKIKYLGSFPTEAEAALAWNREAARIGRPLNKVSV